MDDSYLATSLDDISFFKSGILFCQLPGRIAARERMPAIAIRYYHLIHEWGDILDLVRWSREDGLESELPQELYAFPDALGIHLAESLIEDDETYGVVLMLADPADLAE